MALIDDIKTAASTIPAMTSALAARDSGAVAAAMPVKTALVKTSIGAGTIIAVMGMGNGGGGQFLAKLRSANLPAALADYTDDIKEIMPVIDRGDFDCGSLAARGFLDTMATAGVITSDQCTALKALGEIPVKLTEFEVRCALWAEDGTWLGG